jgi:hypothetical protein
MAYNNAFLIKSVAHQTRPESTLTNPADHPYSHSIERERQLAEALQEEHQQEERKQVVESQGSWVRLIAGKRKGKHKAEERGEHGETKAFDRPPNAYELYAAIDRKDIM